MEEEEEQKPPSSTASQSTTTPSNNENTVEAPPTTLSPISPPLFSDPPTVSSNFTALEHPSVFTRDASSTLPAVTAGMSFSFISFLYVPVFFFHPPPLLFIHTRLFAFSIYTIKIFFQNFFQNFFSKFFSKFFFKIF